MTTDLLAAVLLLWFLLSAAKQFERIEPRLPGGFLGELLPNWKFFAPEPGMSDYRIALRQHGKTGWTDWADITPLRRQPLRWLLHPAKFEAKAMLDVVAFLLEDRRRATPPEAIAISWPYLVLLRYASECAGQKKDMVQFAIVRSREFDSQRTSSPVFVSDSHLIDSAP